MSWPHLLSQNRVERHTPTKQEIDDLRTLIARNLKDAAIVGLSNDNKFGLAYEAALIAAKIGIACAGYRVKGSAHHKTSFEALPLALGSQIQLAADYFERCRRRRNIISYDAAGVVGSSEAEDALREAFELQKSLEAWIDRSHPALKK